MSQTFSIENLLAKTNSNSSAAPVLDNASPTTLPSPTSGLAPLEALVAKTASQRRHQFNRREQSPQHDENDAGSADIGRPISPQVVPPTPLTARELNLRATTFGDDMDAFTASNGQPPPLSQPSIAQSSGHPSLAAFSCQLESRDLWYKFHGFVTEMIITKAGRRMFPSLRVSFRGPIDARAKYAIYMDIVPIDNRRYRYAYHKSCWQVAGKGDPCAGNRDFVYIHPDSPFPGEQLLCQAVSFEKLKLTNNVTGSGAGDATSSPVSCNGQMVLNSMHKYQPRVHIVKISDGVKWYTNSMTELKKLKYRSFVFAETSFIAVTAYQNQLITRLKIENNPFAKGFRETSRLEGEPLSQNQTGQLPPMAGIEMASAFGPNGPVVGNEQTAGRIIAADTISSQLTPKFRPFDATLAAVAAVNNGHLVQSPPLAPPLSNFLGQQWLAILLANSVVAANYLRSFVGPSAGASPTATSVASGSSIGDNFQNASAAAAFMSALQQHIANSQNNNNETNGSANGSGSDHQVVSTPSLSEHLLALLSSARAQQNRQFLMRQLDRTDKIDAVKSPDDVGLDLSPRKSPKTNNCEQRSVRYAPY